MQATPRVRGAPPAHAHPRSAIPDTSTWTACIARRGRCAARARTPRISSRRRSRACSRDRACCSGDDELYYLMRVLRNTFLTSLRTASRRPVTVAAIEDVVAADPRPTSRPEQAYEVQEAVRDDRAAARQLPPGARGGGRARPLLQRGGARAARARGDAHDAACSARASRSPRHSPASRPSRHRWSRADVKAARDEETSGARREDTDAGGVSCSERNHHE